MVRQGSGEVESFPGVLLLLKMMLDIIKSSGHGRNANDHLCYGKMIL